MTSGGMPMQRKCRRSSCAAATSTTSPPSPLVAEVLSDVEVGERRPQPQGPRPAAPDE